jgi:hypothetical protein
MTAPLPDAARPAASPLQRRLGRAPARPNDVPRRCSPTPRSPWRNPDMTTTENTVELIA